MVIKDKRLLPNKEIKNSRKIIINHLIIIDKTSRNWKFRKKI